MLCRIFRGRCHVYCEWCGVVMNVPVNVLVNVLVNAPVNVPVLLCLLACLLAWTFATDLSLVYRSLSLSSSLLLCS
jgi:hypothetical protein